MFWMRKYAAKLACTLILATSFAGNSIAKELRPLEDIAADAARPYSLARCGAMHQAIMEWVGEERLSDNWATSDAIRERFIIYAIFMASADGQGQPEAIAEFVVRDVRNIADRYLARFEANYASEGQAFGNDAIVQSDLDFCKTLIEGLESPTDGSKPTK